MSQFARVTSLHRGIKSSIDKCHHVSFSAEANVTMCDVTSLQNIMPLDAYKQGRTRVMLPDIWMFVEPVLAGFGCVTTQEALVTDQGQIHRERPP